MSPGLELALLVVLLVVVAGLTAIVLRDRRQRPDVSYLDRLKRAVRRDEEEESEPGAIARRLRAAGLPLDGITFLMLCGLVWVLVAWLVRELVPDAPLVALLAGALASYLPWVAVSQWARFRAARFERGLADAVSFLVGALDAGETPHQSFTSAATASQNPVRTAFHGVARRLGLGLDLDPALRPMLEGYDSPSVRLFVHTLLVKWPAGGELAPVLEKAARTIRERLRLKWRLRSQLAGARFAALAVVFLPYLVLPFFARMRPEWNDRIFDEPLGLRLVVVAVLLQVIGVLWLRRLLRIELE